MPDKVFIRNLPDDLWRALKSKASLDGITLSNAVREAVEAYVRGDASIQKADDPWKGIIAIGESGQEDTADRHDAALAQALESESE